MTAVAEKAIGSGDQFVRRQTAEAEAEYRRDVRKLVDLLSKLNPAAKEFVPAAASSPRGGFPKSNAIAAGVPFFAAANDLFSKGLISDGRCRKDSSSDGSLNNPLTRGKKNGHNQGHKRMNEAVGRAEEESIRRTVYVSDVDNQVTEEKLAEVFSSCGQVIDCRICGDPHSVLRFAFIEFSDEDGAKTALYLDGTMLGYHPVKVLPSKTAIMPVNPRFLPKSEDEREMVMRTVYCTNIDRKITQTDVKAFFEQLCGEVSRLRLLGDSIHATRIAFVEFVQAESAIAALNCSGMVLGARPIR
ncbi:polyadenylate-binding protein-interacting protein 11 [Canna indica]|uniref:Polyadenylate-binding protein-interacting protein 11 n=1 Tax=Canna indica TaxID=4628 RepID=A0AAQ3KT55_9LILI|nr:polyadenylate-binding protein-interacting protein 11 [Canna indica]